MKVVGTKRIEEFSRDHADVRSQLAAWLAEVKMAEWQTPLDIRDRYPNASFISGERVVFNIKGNNYRLDVKISYKNQVVLIRRIGTHAAYDEWSF